MNPLVGREGALSELTAHLDATVQGSAGCVVLEGPSGVGKTRLLKATAAKGAEHGLAVVYGRASVNDQRAPIRELVTFLRRVTSSETNFDELIHPDLNPFQLTDRLREFIERATQRRPLLVVLDDAHLADEVSGLALQSLVRSLSASPVLWLLARRQVSARSLAHHAIGWLVDRSAARIRLGPLDEDAMATLCASLLGAEPDSSGLRWAARCGGNPQLLKDVLSALLEAGQVVIVDGTASVLADALPEAALATVNSMLSELPVAVRRLLVHGGSIGRTFAIEEAAASLGESSPDLARHVEAAVQAGLMRRDGSKLSFVHEVVAEALPHLALGSADPVALGPGTDTRVHRSELTGVADAAVRERRGRPVGPRTPATPATSLVRGSDDVVVRAFSALGEASDNAPHTLAKALCLLAGAGRVAEARQLTDLALRPGIGAAADAQLAVELAQGLRDAGCHGMSVAQHRPTLTRRDTREFDRAPYERPLWTWLVRGLVAANQFEAATIVCTAVKQESGKPGVPWPQPLWHQHRAELLLAVGRLDEAHVEAEAGLRLEGRSPEESVPTRAVLARISLHRGDIAAASEHLRTAEQLVTDFEGADQLALVWALAQFHASTGRPGKAVQKLVNIEGQVTFDTLLFTEAPTAAATVVRLTSDMGLSAEPARAADFARRLAERNPTVASLVAGADHAAGLLRKDPAALRRAVEHYRLSGRPLATGAALEDAARQERSLRHDAEAVRLLESALDLYLECGARRDITRVQKHLGRLGVHNVRALSSDRPKAGWESLTSAELRVVRAIVDGRTNREAASMLFLSPHTVDSHLRRVFAKLNINSRVELTKQFIAHEASVSVPVAPPRPPQLRPERHLPNQKAG